MTIGVLAVAVMGLPTVMWASPEPVELNSCSSFTILAGTTITTTGGGIINGNVGLFPAGSHRNPIEPLLAHFI